ncbi:MAG TPA: hypothetical protein VFO07_18790 [Roseiflexaceae bacterium]|nr:hypothetical protein [Roseiflexaceae bacterium]
MVKWIGIGLAVVVVILVAFIAAAYIFPEFRVATRDIAIILLAALSMISIILTITLLFAIIYAVMFIRQLTNDTVVPQIIDLKARLDGVVANTHDITDNVKDTTTAVSTTTVYIAEKAVSPIIRVAGLLAGVRAAARYVARRDEAPEPDNG